MNGTDYAAYLLKNYNALKSELAFMEKELENRGTKGRKGGCCRFAGLIEDFTRSRYSVLSDERLSNTIRLVSAELEALDRAMGTLEQSEQGLLKDLYIHRISWIRASQKWYLSEPTISRHRKKSLQRLGQFLGKGVSDTALKVIACADRR